MISTWFKSDCPNCQTINWICGYDFQDVDAVKCRSCKKIYPLGDIPIKEFLKDMDYDSMDDSEYEEGLEIPT